MAACARSAGPDPGLLVCCQLVLICTGRIVSTRQTSTGALHRPGESRRRPARSRRPGSMGPVALTITRNSPAGVVTTAPAPASRSREPGARCQRSTTRAARAR